MSRIKISCEEARDIHGVTCEHERMDNNELRFRILKTDGTAYIRTEAPPGGGWQNAHYHERIRETYIVQKGWIGSAETIHGIKRFRIYNEEELFTTRPGVVHNIYMPPDAVIHTVKHGDCSSNDRMEDDESRAFTVYTSGISEQDLRALSDDHSKSAGEHPANPGPDEQKVAYRHFDNLIWQITGWSTAVFAVTISGLAQMRDANVILSLFELTNRQVASILCGIMSMMIFALWYALSRFRWHQISAKDYTPANPLKSPQIALQLIVNIQALSLAAFPLMLLLHSLAWVAAILISVMLISTIVVETYLIEHGKAGGRPVSTKS